MVKLFRHRQPKAADTAKPHLSPPRHIPTYMRLRLSRGISVVFNDLDNLWLRMWARNQTPPPRSGVPGAGRAHIRNLILTIANIFLANRSCVCLSCGFVQIQGEPFA
jgi:hypothetical protein